jgi:hypothetical protein
MIDSYSNSLNTAKHKLSAYPQESDLLSWSVYWSEGDKHN